VRTRSRGHRTTSVCRGQSAAGAASVVPRSSEPLEAHAAAGTRAQAVHHSVLRHPVPAHPQTNSTDVTWCTQIVPCRGDRAEQCSSHDVHCRRESAHMSARIGLPRCAPWLLMAWGQILSSCALRGGVTKFALSSMPYWLPPPPSRTAFQQGHDVHWPIRELPKPPRDRRCSSTAIVCSSDTPSEKPPKPLA